MSYQPQGKQAAQGTPPTSQVGCVRLSSYNNRVNDSDIIRSTTIRLLCVLNFPSRPATSALIDQRSCRSNDRLIPEPTSTSQRRRPGDSRASRHNRPRDANPGSEGSAVTRARRKQTSKLRFTPIIVLVGSPARGVIVYPSVPRGTRGSNPLPRKKPLPISLLSSSLTGRHRQNVLRAAGGNRRLFRGTRAIRRGRRHFDSLRAHLWHRT